MKCFFVLNSQPVELADMADMLLFSCVLSNVIRVLNLVHIIAQLRVHSPKLLLKFFEVNLAQLCKAKFLRLRKIRL